MDDNYELENIPARKALLEVVEEVKDNYEPLTVESMKAFIKDKCEPVKDIVATVHPDMMAHVNKVVVENGEPVAVVEDKETNEVIDELAEKVEKPEKVPGLCAYKDMMRRLFTVRHQRVKACGHPYTGQDPRTNCEYCWFAFFNENGEFTKTVDEMWRDPEKRHVVISMRGKKFAKMFTRFMSTIARLKAEAEKGINVGAEQGEPVQATERLGEDAQRTTEDNNVAG